MSGSYSAPLRDWIREEIADKDQVKLPDLARSAAQHFAKDTEFVQAFFEAHLYPLVYEVAQRTMAQTRGANNVVNLGDELVTKPELRRRASGMAHRWNKWMEHCGDRHVRLMDMTHEDRLLAISERRQRAAAENRIGDLIEAIDERAPTDKRIGDVFTAEEIQALYERMDGEQREAAD